MSFARGERVYFDLDGDFSEQLSSKNEPPSPPVASTNFVADITERAPSTTNPPPAPTFKATPTGFPEHKKRANRVSAFKQRRQAKADAPESTFSSFLSNPKPTPGSTKKPDVLHEDDKRRIDQENKELLAGMSEAEIEQERKELFEGLPPGLIEKLLARANLNDGSNEQDFDSESESGLEPEQEPEAPVEPTDQEQPEPKPKPSTKKKVTFEETPDTPASPPKYRQPTVSDSTEDPASTPNTTTLPDTQLLDTASALHFPTPPQPPDLDPNSSSFLTDLHDKYFADLPYDPSTVSWMKPLENDTSSPYHPSQQALSAAELRFDFKGALLAPSHAREIPVTKGLHHHGDAPEAAGYTISELAILARSAVASQRCFAYQTLGRILYRLGKGEFGEEEGMQRVEGPAGIAKDPGQMGELEIEEMEGEESVGSAMCTGLWNCVEQGRVIETLTEEANRERGHLSARTYAQEALWNWRRGGGRKRKAV